MSQEEQQPGPLRQHNNLAESSNDESGNEEDDNTTCKTSKSPWLELTKKCGDWVQCDICDRIYLTREIFP